jgi:hypothetical protein
MQSQREIHTKPVDILELDVDDIRATVVVVVVGRRKGRLIITDCNRIIEKSGRKEPKLR